MKTIYIVGGNGYARECYDVLNNIIKTDKNIQFGGFLGHGGYGHTVDYKNKQNFYIGEVNDHTFKENEYCIIGAGYPDIRKKIYEDLKEKGVKFYNLISNNSYITDSVELGEANIIFSSSISVNIKIGNCNVFNGDVILGHDCEIGDFNFLGPRSQALGAVKIGNYNQIGANTIILPRSKIGNNNKIAPLSAVYKGCKNNCYLAGNPALKIGNIEDYNS